MSLFSISTSLHAEVNVVPSDAVVVFKLQKNNEEQGYFLAQIDVANLPKRTKETTWEIAYNAMRPITDIISGNGSLASEKTTGSFYSIKFKLPPNTTTIKFDVQGKGQIKNYTDTPQGYFLIEHSENPNQPSKEIIYSVKKSYADFPKDFHEVCKSSEDRRDKFNTSIENNPTETKFTADETQLVPLPVDISRHKEQDFILNKKTVIRYQLDGSKIAQKAADFFQSSLNQATGYSLNVQPANDDQIIPNTILLTSQKTSRVLNKKQSGEGYVIEVQSEYIIVRALTDRGFFYALQSLKQLLPPEIYKQHKSAIIEWKIPGVTIVDYPRFSYRGLHLDVARNFFTVDQVKRLLDLMAIHKLNYFHWHLTDDEGWRIEIKKYPELTKIGGYRAYVPNRKDANYLQPAYGSGPKTYGGYYSQDEIREIVKYAQDRFITIVPEIDMPGHARAMIISMPDQLVDKHISEHKSVQGYSDNVISPCIENTYTIIENIIKEVAELFPGKYLHVGGDEVPEGAWKNSAACKKLNFDSSDPAFKNKLQNYFLTRVQKIVRKHGKIMAGWEEVASNASTLSPPLLVYIWNNENIDQVYKKSKEMGYQVIMAPAKNLYFDHVYNPDPNEPGQCWAGFVDTFSAYVFKPIDSDRGHSEDVIKGVQGQLWSEEINSGNRLDYFAFPRVAALAELAWTPAHSRNWKNFYERMHYFHMKRLDNYGVKYRKNEFE